jgi:hypothetical protein
MTDAIKVTVDGPPVTAEVTLEQVREYLRRKGWVKSVELECAQLWTLNRKTGAPEEPKVDVFDFPPDRLEEAAIELRYTVLAVARHEQREPSEVLREIAGGAATSAEALADEIEAQRRQVALTVDDALRWAREHYESVGRGMTADSKAKRRINAGAWLLVAQRMIAREADR